VSVFVWSMIGIALWHFTILVPDRFAGGIIGAFLAAWAGAMASGFVLEGFEVPNHNPPGMKHVLYALPGSIFGLVACWVVGDRAELTARRSSGPTERTPATGPRQPLRRGA
jgi:hypothetical protein